jgi:hypothetical protein
MVTVLLYAEVIGISSASSRVPPSALIGGHES